MLRPQSLRTLPLWITLGFLLVMVAPVMADQTLQWETAILREGETIRSKSLTMRLKPGMIRIDDQSDGTATVVRWEEGEVLYLNLQNRTYIAVGLEEIRQRHQRPLSTREVFMGEDEGAKEGGGQSQGAEEAAKPTVVAVADMREEAEKQGFPSHRYQVLATGLPSIDVWSSTESGVQEELWNFGDDVNHILNGYLYGNVYPALQKRKEFNGFPVLYSIDVNNPLIGLLTAVSRLVSVEGGSLDDSIFDLPPGFRKEEIGYRDLPGYFNLPLFPRKPPNKQGTPESE